MMNRHFIFALCTVLGFSVSGISMAQSVPTDKEAAAKAAKAAKVKFRWGKSLKSAQKQAEETGLPIVLLFTGTSWCGFCVKLEKEILSKKDFKQGMDGVAIGVKFEFGSSDFSKSKEAKTYNIYRRAGHGGGGCGWQGAGPHGLCSRPYSRPVR